VAIDDTVHFLSRYVRARAQGAAPDAAARTAARQAGQMIVLTTGLLCAGLCVTLFSGFFPIRLFGAMMVVTLTSAVAADLVVLPALLTWRAR